MKKLSKYEKEVHEATTLLHDVVIIQNYVYGYHEKLYKLAVSRTFNRKDWNYVLLSIAFAHNIDITRINCDYIYECVLEPELG